MTVSISSAVIGLFNLFIWSWFNFGKWYLSRKLSISFKFSNFVEYRFSKYDLMILYIFSASVVMSNFHFWFCYFGYSLSAFCLVWIKVCLFCWFSQRTNSLSHWFFVLFSLFLFCWFQLSVDYFLPSSSLGWVCFFLF